MTAPSFAVVGRPNKGKSSIVATLARDDSVYIDARAGSTRAAQTYPMVVNEETLYTLVDTPGMQRARAVLDWLQSHCSDAAARPQTVRDFVEQHEADPRFGDECQLLRPIIDGAGIIYVVDGSCPFGSDYEAEMEILRWCGQPSLALINPIDNDDFAAQWKNGLGQFFRTVRNFNAQRAEFAKQLELLELFGHLDDSWRQPLQRAVKVLRDERKLQHRSASLLIGELISNAIRFETRQKVLPGLPEEAARKVLFSRYRTQLSDMERHCRRQVEEVYYYLHLQRSESELALDESDLFSLDHWYLWGLNRKSLAAVATSAGALVGGSAGALVDGVTGGLLGGSATLTTGLVGAVSGALGAWKYADEIAQLRISGLPAGGRELIYGPSRNLNFPFVLLGRSLLHHQMLCRRTHADRSQLDLQDDLLETLDDRQRRRLGQLFAQLRAGKREAESRTELAALICKLCEKHDG